jgi:GGDEF domain-containing protein
VKAAKLAQAIAAEEVVWENAPLQVTVAYGAHTLTGNQPADDALEAADKAMYANKRSARGEG